MKLVPYQDENGTWRIDHVPLCSTGIEYPLASGSTTFTEDHLTDIVASQGDSAIKVPRIKLGHSSEYNAALVGDAEQAFGRVENLELGNSGQTIFGDYVGMPEWLAKVLPIAYPNRSIEGCEDAKTNTGKEWRAVVFAVSLLGVRWPGVSTLEDLPSWYGADTPPDVEIDEPINNLLTGGRMKPGEAIKAAVDIDLVERTFGTEVAQGDQYWWWIRGERYEDSTGLQLIVDCDPEARIVRIPVSVSGSDITFGDPVEVTEEYPDKTPVAASAFVAGMAASDRSRGADVVVFASRADTMRDRPDIRATQGGTMDDATRRALATRVGLDPETATEDEINTTIDGLREAAPPEGGEGGEEPTPPEGEGGEEPIEAGNGTVTVDADRFRQLEAGAKAGLEERAERIKREDEEFLTAAIKVGKFSPARKAHYQALMASDREGARQLIDGLEAGLLPLEERGASGNGGGEAGEGGENDGLLGMDAGLDRTVTAARNGEVAGRHGRVMNAREA